MDDLDEQQAEQQDEQAQGDEAAADASQAAETQADDTTAAAESAEQPTEEEGEVVVTFGDEPASNDDEIEGKPAPSWVKELRKENRELKKIKREYEQERAARATEQAAKNDELGPEPDLADPDIDYDKELFKQKWTAWNDRKTKADAKAKAEREAQEAQVAEWNQKVTAYKSAGAKFSGFEDSESAVTTVLNPTQAAILVEGPKSPTVSAQLVSALGKNPDKLKELASITNPVKFSFAVAELVSQLKVQAKNNPPAPERQVRGTAGGATGVDNHLARLQAEADKTGDRTKVAKYLREKKHAA